MGDWDRADLIRDIRSVAHTVPYAPRGIDLDEHAHHPHHAFIDEWGDIETAIAAAGLPTYNVDHSIPLEELLADIQRVATIVGRQPTQSDVATHGEYYIDTYRDRLDTWSDVLVAAGFDPVPYGTAITRAELITELEQLHAEFDAPPTRGLVTSYGRFSVDAYDQEFDSWTAALEAADIPEQRYQIPTSDLITELQDLAARLDRTPTGGDIAEHADYSTTTYHDRFGTLATAYAAADLDPPTASDDKPFRSPSS